MSGRIITAPGWSFAVEVVGEDLVVRNTTATWFGGDNDPNDNGETASGVRTKGNPALLGCALPMNYQGKDAATRKALAGSPLPWLAGPGRQPWGLNRDGSTNAEGAHVVVTCGRNSQMYPLIDMGPAKWTKDGIDLTRQAFRNLGGPLHQGVIKVDYRVLGGAKYL